MSHRLMNSLFKATSYFQRYFHYMFNLDYYRAYWYSYLNAMLSQQGAQKLMFRELQQRE